MFMMMMMMMGGGGGKKGGSTWKGVRKKSTFTIHIHVYIRNQRNCTNERREKRIQNNNKRGRKLVSQVGLKFSFAHNRRESEDNCRGGEDGEF